MPSACPNYSPTVRTGSVPCEWWASGTGQAVNVRHFNTRTSDDSQEKKAISRQAIQLVQLTFYWNNLFSKDITEFALLLIKNFHWYLNTFNSSCFFLLRFFIFFTTIISHKTQTLLLFLILSFILLSHIFNNVKIILDDKLENFRR